MRMILTLGFPALRNDFQRIVDLGVVAALEKRVTAKYPSDGKNKSHEKATFFKCFESIG